MRADRFFRLNKIHGITPLEGIVMEKMTFDLIDGKMVQRKKSVMERIALHTPPFVAPLILLICVVLQVKMAFLAYPFFKALINLIP